MQMVIFRYTTFNFATGASIWDHPCDEYFGELCLLLLMMMFDQ